MLYKTILYIIFYCCLLINISLAQTPDNKITVKEYIDTYKDIAIKEMKSKKIPASITLAQGILESEYGNSDLAIIANNHFGIKCHSDWKGKTYHKDDDEADECFRKYKRTEQSFMDHSNFLAKRSRYAFLFEYPISDYKKWAKGLKKAGYATDPAYANLLIQIIENNELYNYDMEFASKQKKLASSEIFEHNRIKTILTKEGDTPSKIARKHHISTQRLLKYNDLNMDIALKPGTKFYLQPKRNKSIEKYHYTKDNENMYDLSQEYGIKLSLLYALNKMYPPEESATGEKIYLNKTRDVPPKLKTHEAGKFNENNIAQYYTIQPGETLYSIAQKFQVPVDKLRKLNALESDIIHPGDKLQVIIND